MKRSGCFRTISVSTQKCVVVVIKNETAAGSICFVIRRKFTLSSDAIFFHFVGTVFALCAATERFVVFADKTEFD
jgi:hypothetical protein